jgi:hypothetical protein
VKITIPRMDLVVPVNPVRPAKGVREPLKMPIKKVRYFTDSSGVLRSLRRKKETSMNLWKQE